MAGEEAKRKQTSEQTQKDKPKRPLPAGMKPWQKGQSGNPGGRPKGLAARIREMTNDGQTILDMLADIVANEKAKDRDRIQAGQVLLDRGFGKAIETSVSLTAHANLPVDVEVSSDTLLENMARLLQSRAASPSLPAPTAVSSAVSLPETDAITVEYQQVTPEVESDRPSLSGQEGTAGAVVGVGEEVAGEGGKGQAEGGEGVGVLPPGDNTNARAGPQK